MADIGRNEKSKQNAQDLVRKGIKAFLGSFDEVTGSPYVSLVACATEPQGTPIFLLSRLARHTKNIQQNSRISVLYDGTGSNSDPLAGLRMTVVGEIHQLEQADEIAMARRRFLKRHADAAVYVDFADFAFYRIHPTAAHLIGGFGVIEDVKAADLCINCSMANELLAVEEELIAHLNDAHFDTVQRYGETLQGRNAATKPWVVTGIDPMGLDLMSGGCGERLRFPSMINTPEDLKDCLARPGQMLVKSDQ